MDLARGKKIILFCATLAVGVSVEAASIRSFRNLTLPLYVEQIRTPVAVLRVRSTERDHLQKGFFKFGVFPILKVNRLSIDVHHAAQTRSVFERVNSVLSSLQPKGEPRSATMESQDSQSKRGIVGITVEEFELRRFEQGRVQFHLTANQASKFGQGQWKLRNGKLVMPDREEQFARATLKITENDFVLHLPSARSVSLFPLLSTNLHPETNTSKRGIPQINTK
jgi:hypothetical protein